jgi:uncharacterized protein YjbI with pentapeptide repeats
LQIADLEIADLEIADLQIADLQVASADLSRIADCRFSAIGRLLELRVL